MTKCIVVSLALLSALTARGQVLMGVPDLIHLLPSDAAILEGRELRTDMPCTVRTVRPELGFDLVFHSGYEVSVPLQDVAGDGNRLIEIFRVIPDGHPDQAVYFSQKWTVPPLSQGANGTAYLQGWIELGEGKYQVEWLMRDSGERYCSTRWEILAEPRGKDRQVELRIGRGMVQPQDEEPFDSEEPVTRDVDHPLHVMVLLHLASEFSGAVGMRATETAAMLSILRSIAREPRIGSYSIIAFNVDQRQILFRREDAPKIDFPALGEAIKQLNLGAIDVQRLRRKDSGAQFLGEVLGDGMRSTRPDALIFVGPRTTADFPSHGAWKELAEPRCPVFYLNYDASPESSSWRDLIESVVKTWKGFEYTISRPRDLFLAWNEVMSRISNPKPITGAAARPSQ